MAILAADKAKWNHRHLLLMGNTKTGKTRYTIEAVRDGYEAIYIDSDNGLSTIQSALANTPEALQRLHYFSPADVEGFLAELLTAGAFRYNETRRIIYNPQESAPTDQLCEIFPGRIPQRALLVMDSWTSLTYKALRNQALRRSVDLQDIEKYTREIYGGAGFQITQIAQILQAVKFGVIVIAHSASYERKKKPPGRVSDVLEKDMIIVETLLVPISTSLPHGFTIGKHFDEIANMIVKPTTNAREIDFTISADRISGGTPGTKGDPMTTHRYATLFGKPPAKAENEPTWIRYTTVGDFKAAQAAAKAVVAAPVKPAVIPQPKVIVVAQAK